jgi:hypothetical protein
MARVPAQDTSEIRRVFGMLGIFGMLVIYFVIARPNVRPTAHGQDAAAVGSTTKPERDKSARPLMGLLDSAKDGSAIDLEDDAYRSLVLHMTRLTVAEVDSRAVYVRTQELLEDPERYRGTFVRARGVLIAPMGMRRLDQKPAGVELAYRGFLVDTANDDAYCFDVLERPLEIDPRREACEIVGIFLRVATYDTQQNKVKRIPLIVARSLVKVEGRENPWGGATMLLVAAIAFASLPLVGIFIANVWKRARQGEEVDLINRARARRTALPSKPVGPFPGANVTVLGPAQGAPAPPPEPPPPPATEPPPAPPPS